jgi:hypothetical protein
MNETHYHEKRITIPVYGFRLRIIFSNDVAKLNKHNLNGGEDNVFAHVLDNTLPIVLVLNFWDKTKMNHGVIAHECVHIAHEVFRNIGQSLTYHNEPYAYLIEWLTNQVYDFMKKKGIEL